MSSSSQFFFCDFFILSKLFKFCIMPSLWKKSLCAATIACNVLAISQRRKKKKIALRNCGIESAGATKLFRPKKSAAVAALRTKNARTIWSNASKKKAWKNATNVHNSRAKKSKACSNAPPNTKRNAKNCAHAKNTRCWKNHFSGKKKICENKIRCLKNFAERNNTNVGANSNKANRKKIRECC